MRLNIPFLVRLHISPPSTLQPPRKKFSFNHDNALQDATVLSAKDKDYEEMLKHRII